ncbi:MAG: response regulator [Candidatus Omnitrophica bacterium]|nr:response regulator [Candidatus Omnitrophota bacterium]
MAKNILVIDDEGIVTKSIQKLLRKEGYHTVIATSGQEAIEQCKISDFDLIVSDIRMPQLNGIETIQKIRQVMQEQKKKPVPEILITGYADEDSYKKALNLKVTDYIYKPFDTKEFLDTVKRNLDVAKE